MRLKILNVYRYKSSGKLIAGMLHGHFLPLNHDLSFAKKGAHRVLRETELEDTPYRLEIEVTTKGNIQVVRAWDEDHLPVKTKEPNAPLEHRIDISPSQEFSANEDSYIGKSAGSEFGFLLIVIGVLLSPLLLADLTSWPLLCVVIGPIVAGFILAKLTKSDGDSTKILEVEKAKERVREVAKNKINEAMNDVNYWAKMGGIEFEHAVARLYKKQGYDVETTSRSNDHGVDLIIRRNGLVSIVQCKAYKNNVGVSAVRELAGARLAWPDAAEAILVTLYGFSRGAKELAAEYEVNLFSVTKDHFKTDYRPKNALRKRKGSTSSGTSNHKMSMETIREIHRKFG